jgi:hypothetical protein
MPRRVRRDRKESRQFSGQKDAELVLECLNGSARPEHKRLAANVKARVRAVIDAIRMLLRAMEQNPGWFKNLDSAEDREGVSAKCAPEVRDALTAVNLLLYKYSSFSLIHPDPRAKRLWSVSEALAGNRVIVEATAVHAVVRLADTGLLDRLQTCACGKWYFARFSHQRFCSPECRVTFWESSEERKEQKRKLARQYYVHHKIHDRGERS